MRSPYPSICQASFLPPVYISKAFCGLRFCIYNFCKLRPYLSFEKHFTIPLISVDNIIETSSQIVSGHRRFRRGRGVPRQRELRLHFQVDPEASASRTKGESLRWIPNRRVLTVLPLWAWSVLCDLGVLSTCRTPERLAARCLCLS